MKRHLKSTQIIEPKSRAIIYGHGRGWVFTPRDLTQLGDPRSVGMALTRLSRKGVIRQLVRGLYDFPRRHRQLGLLSPTPDAIARALAGRDSTRVQPSGGYAANQLGLSDQVPMKVVFLTDGFSRKVTVGNQQIVLKRTTPRNMVTAGRVSGLVIQALRWLGQRHVDDSVVRILSNRLSPDDKKQMLKDLKYAPAWVASIMRRVAQSKGN